ncbi:hypothetical protein CDAR_20991 [Caerostris darwini]|uniref:LAGLIDADG homing endonuclease n=1 Tax=Caerostris darwini TaxID=1538125 RepID=A0AAV4TW03_9ARAC|nr:hypothetical protein CDAR_20991 [Caerostris darwini]
MPMSNKTVPDMDAPNYLETQSHLSNSKSIKKTFMKKLLKKYVLFVPFYFEAGKWACIRSGSVKFALLVQLKEILMKLNSGIHFK